MKLFLSICSIVKGENVVKLFLSIIVLLIKEKM